MADGARGGKHVAKADVKRPLMSVAKMVAAGNRVHLDSKDPRIVRPNGDVIPRRKAGNVFVDLWVRKDATCRRPGFYGQACVQNSASQMKDRPQGLVRSGGAARGRKVVGFDLGGVEDGQEECKF